MHTKRFTMTTLAGAMIGLAACGGDDDATSEKSAPEPGISSPSDSVVDSPGEGTVPPAQGTGPEGAEGEEGASPCPLLSDEDAATALGLEPLTMDGQGGNCTWITSQGKPALQVLPADHLRSPDAATPEEQARVYGEGTCSLDEPRLITASGGVGIVCGKEDGNSAVFTSAHAYQVNIGDPLGSADNAKLAKNDALANVIEQLQLGDG